MNRETIALDGIWEILADPGKEGHSAGYFRPDHDSAAWGKARIPGGYPEVLPDSRHYVGFLWHRKAFAVPAGWQGRRIRLLFWGVYARAEVWLDGNRLGLFPDGQLPFGWDVTRWLLPGIQHRLTVLTDNTARLGDVPGGRVGWWPAGGILREVILEASGIPWIEDLRVEAFPGGTGGQVRVAVTVAHGQGGDRQVRVNMTAGEAKGDLGVCLLRPGQPETLTGELAVPQAQPWSPEQPRLYDFTVKLWEGEEETDCLTRRIGFRRIEARGARIELNGAPLFLKGFNYHEDSPRTGMAPDPEGGRRDLEGMKAAGANFVRLAHYPHHPATLDLCDQLGLLTLAEIPLWQWRIAKPDPEATALTAAAAERQLRAMIARDGHHPSVIFWSVSNECAEDQEGVVAAIHNLLRLARQEDPGRLAVHVSNYWLKHPHFEEDDVICVNHYPSWGKRLGPDGHGYDLAKSADDWRSALEALHRRYPGKPVLVTEFGYPALAGIPGGGAGEVTQAKVIEGEMGGIRHPAVCGMALWCWADHEWTFHDLPALGPITISPFGVVTRNRQPKAALKVLSRLFRELRGGGPESP